MSVNKKYYYLKLKDTFFDSEEMKILESQKNGFLYQNLYLKLCLLSVKSEGALLFKDMLPYNVDMIATITRIDIDNVRSGLSLFQKLGLITVMDNETIYMNDIQSLIGHSSTEAERKKKYRELLSGQKVDNNGTSSGTLSQNCPNFCPPEIEIEKDKEKELDKERELENSPPSFENDCYYDEDTGYYTDKPKSNNIIEKIQNQFGVDNEYNKFTTEIVKVFTELTCKTATEIFQVHGFKTPQKQQELKEIFNNRKYNWKQAIDLAKEQAIKRPDVSKHFLEFTQLLPIFLTKGAEGIKRELSQAEIKAKQEAELNKKTDLEVDAGIEKLSIEDYLANFENILKRRYKFYTEDLKMPEEKVLDIINGDRNSLKRKIKEHNDVRKTQYSI